MKRRTLIASAVAVGCLCGIAALANAVFMRDWLMPRSRVGLAYAASLDYSILTADLDALDAMAKQKYGPDASAAFSSEKGAIFRIGDRDIEEAPMPQHLNRIYGLFAVGRGAARQRFPYSIVPDESERQKREVVSHEQLKRFHSRAPRLFAYTDSDWRLEGCETFATPLIGYANIDEKLQLGSSDLCRVRWLKEPQKTMLIGGVVANGGVWVRRWIVPLCRVLAKGWLEQSQAAASPIDYVACNVIYDPQRPTRGTDEIMDRRVYHVRDGGLAIIE